MNTPAEILESVRKKGVDVWLVEGQLRYRACKGTLTEEELESLRASKGKIITLLQEAIPSPKRAPLAFSQLAHWNWFRLYERNAIRQVATATRLRGKLDVSALKKGVSEVVRRHDSLRTRIRMLDGVPTQEIPHPGIYEFAEDDLTATPEDLREVEVLRKIDQHVLEPIDLNVGPLFGVRLLRLEEKEHVLILAMEHIIADMFSAAIVLKEILTAYGQALQDRAFSLPPVSMQFSEYATNQRAGLSSWLDAHGPFWADHWAQYGRLRFPQDRDFPSTGQAGWGIVPVKIGRDLKAELRVWCRTKRTTLVMSVLTAYAALVLRWCNSRESVIRFQSDGRDDPHIENTVGFLSSVLYLRVGLRDDDTFPDLLGRLTEELCTAYTHADYYYLASQVPRPEFTHNTQFNWIPQETKTDLSDSNDPEQALTYSSVLFEHPMLKKKQLDHEPGVLFYDTDEGVHGNILVPLDRFSIEMMESFARNFLLFINVLLKNPEAHVKDIALL